MTGPADMPAAEVDLNADQVRALLSEQYPALAKQPIVEAGFGWDNFMFRVGERFVARFPRRAVSAPMVEAEARWLPVLAPRLPIPIPAPIHLGEPGHGFPWSWTIAPWISGRTAVDLAESDQAGCGRQIGSFLASLHGPSPSDAPSNPFRGGPLAEKHRITSDRLDGLGDAVDVGRLRHLWDQACSVPHYTGPPLWLHGDLHPHNVVTEAGVVVGIIDFTDLTGGDPACDLMIGWTMFDPLGREKLIDAYGAAPSALSERARGWAIHHGAACIANGADNPIMTMLGLRTLSRVLDSADGS